MDCSCVWHSVHFPQHLASQQALYTTHREEQNSMKAKIHWSNQATEGATHCRKALASDPSTITDDRVAVTCNQCRRAIARMELAESKVLTFASNTHREPNSRDDRMKWWPFDGGAGWARRVANLDKPLPWQEELTPPCRMTPKQLLKALDKEISRLGRYESVQPDERIA